MGEAPVARDCSETITSSTVKIEAHGPMGWWAKITGLGVQALLVAMVICLSVGAVWWQGYQNEANAKSRDETTHNLLGAIIRAQSENMKVNTQLQAQNTRAIEVLTYVTSLNEREKSSLNLAMPEELRHNARRAK